MGFGLREIMKTSINEDATASFYLPEHSAKRRGAIFVQRKSPQRPVQGPKG